jgi:hypothetical protein
VKDIGDNCLFQQTLRTRIESRKPQGKRKKIWNIDVLMEGMVEKSKSETHKELQWDTLVGRIEMMLIVYTYCGIRDMFNIISERSVWENKDRSVLLAMRAKDSRDKFKYRSVL